jgi:hypothetical protein
MAPSRRAAFASFLAPMQNQMEMSFLGHPTSRTIDGQGALAAAYPPIASATGAALYGRVGPSAAVAIIFLARTRHPPPAEGVAGLFTGSRCAHRE